MLGKILKHVKQGTLVKVIWNKYHPNKFFIRVLKLPHIYNRLEYKRKFGLFKSINQPETFSQKIYYLRDKYDQNLLATQLSDKYKVRKYIKEIGLSHILNELYGVYKSAAEIEFEKLPKSFVIKANHASGTNLIIKNKSEINKKKIMKKIARWLKKNYAYRSGEMQYFNIKPMIIIEKYLEDDNSDNKHLIDYKFWCFNGEPKFLYLRFVDVNSQRGYKIYGLDLDFNKSEYIESDEDVLKINKPKKFDEMVDYARKISKPFSFSRVDLYYVNQSIVFGEITLTPTSGNNYYIKQKAQQELGDMIKI